MWVFLTHHLILRSTENKVAFFQRLSDHAELSRSLNWFTATIQDYGITIKATQERILIRSKFGQENFRIILNIREAKDGCILHVTIKPTKGDIVIKALFALFLIVCPFPFGLKIIFVGVFFISGLIALALKVWWTSDLFEKKLFARN